jgi:hypothetical protein
MSSQITLFAARTGTTGVWRPMDKPDFEGVYSPKQQKKNREQDATAQVEKIKRPPCGGTN